MVTISKVGEKRPKKDSGEEGQAKPSQRGKCRGFTRWARKRMGTAIAQINRGKVQRVFFVSLTEPEGAVDWKGIEKHRRAYCERFRRQWGDRAFFIWKKEPQENGTPHLHALVFWVTPPPDWQEFVDWNDPAWAEVTGNVPEPGKKHTACNVKWLNGWGGVAFYLAKYMGKLVKGGTEEQEETGRIWGTFNKRARAKVVALRQEVLTPAVGVRVARVLRKLQEKKRRRWLHWSHSEKRWFRVPATGKFQGNLLEPARRVRGDAAEMARLYAECGIIVKLSKPRVFYVKKTTVWEMNEEDRGGRRPKVYYTPVGVEYEACPPSRHFVSCGEADRLVGFFKGERDPAPF